MTEQVRIDLPGGISLRCRASGPPDAPKLVFLHGFPEAAFVWDEMLAHFGSRYRCVAPNLRGFDGSSSPREVEAYRSRFQVADLSALIDSLGGRVEGLIAHDWGGASAWTLAALRPDQLRRLVIINSPHPATFLHALQHDPAQRAASSYMNFLCRPDAEALLAENDFARIWPFFRHPGSADPSQPGAWLDAATKERYREVWRSGLTGGCNYYRASPLRPPTAGDDSIMRLQLPPELVTVSVPTRVIWALDDTALLPVLLDGLADYVSDLTVIRVPGASHWIVHERPAFVAAEIERALAG